MRRAAIAILASRAVQACRSGVDTTRPSSASLTLIWHDSREFGRTSKPKSSMSSSIGDGAPTFSPGLIDIDVAGRAGTGAAAFGFDARNGVADRGFHHCRAVFDFNGTGFAAVVDKVNLGHDCSCCRMREVRAVL